MGKPNASVINEVTSGQSSKARGIVGPTRRIYKSKSCGSRISSFLSNKPVSTRVIPKWKKNITEFLKIETKKMAAHVSCGDDEFQDPYVRKEKNPNLLEFQDGSDDRVKNDTMELDEDGSNFEKLFDEFTNLKL